MDRITKLLAARGVIVDKATALAKQMDELLAKADGEGRDLTDEEKKAFDALEKDVDKAGIELKTADENIAREKKIQEIKAQAATRVDLPGNERRESVVPAQARYRHGKLKAFKGANAEEDAYIAGKFLMATLLTNGPNGLDEVGRKALAWCQERGVAIQRAAAENSNTAGGYLVPTQFEQAIIDLREEYGTFRRMVPVLPMSSDTMTVPKRTGGLTAYFVDENPSATITESDKAWGQVRFVAKKLAALSRMSTEISEDAIISIADDLAMEMAYAFAIKEDSVGWNGTGSSSDGGIIGVRTKFTAGLQSGSTPLAGAVDAASGHDTFAEIDAADLRKLMAVVPVYARRNAKWYGSQIAWDLTFAPLIQAAGGLTGEELGKGFPKRYLGYEFVMDITLPTAQTDISDTPMIGFGDLGLACKMAQRRGITVMQSDQRYFELDQVGIRATERIDINVHDIGDATNAGPFAMLMGE